MLTALGIIAIVASIAVPSIISWRNNSQLRRATQDLYSNFQNAKVQAVRNNTICAIVFNGGAGSYTIFMDNDQDFTLDPGEDIRTVSWSEYPGVSLDTSQGGGDGLTFSNPNNAIAFAPNGFCLNNSGALASGTVFLKNNNKQTQIDITATGNVSIN